MAEAIQILLEVADPISIICGTGNVKYELGEKDSAIDAGEVGQISITDDYLYVCVQAGGAGSAVWKKAVLFAT